jgi:hypothetical protein
MINEPRVFEIPHIPQYIHDAIQANIQPWPLLPHHVNHVATTTFSTPVTPDRLNIVNINRVNRHIAMIAEALNARLCLRMKTAHPTTDSRVAVGFVVPADFAGEDLCIFEFDPQWCCVLPHRIDQHLGTYLSFVDLTPDAIRTWASNSAFCRIHLPQE